MVGADYKDEFVKLVPRVHLSLWGFFLGTQRLMGRLKVRSQNVERKHPERQRPPELGWTHISGLSESLPTAREAPLPLDFFLMGLTGTSLIYLDLWPTKRTFQRAPSAPQKIFGQLKQDAIIIIILKFIIILNIKHFSSYFSFVCNENMSSGSAQPPSPLFNWLSCRTSSRRWCIFRN